MKTPVADRWSPAISQAGISLLNFVVGEASASSVEVSGGAMLGWNILLGDVFDLSLGAGGQYVVGEADVNGTRLSTTGFRPSARLALGFAF